MAKEVAALIKLQVKGGAANPAPPIGPALGAKGVNIMEFCKRFNALTQDKAGKVLPVIITVYVDKSFEFISEQDRTELFRVDFLDVDERMATIEMSHEKIADGRNSQRSGKIERIFEIDQVVAVLLNRKGLNRPQTGKRIHRKERN